MPSPLIRPVLDAQACVGHRDDPEAHGVACAELFVSGACHRGAPVFARYTKADGQLTLFCAVCGQWICALQVARHLDVV